MSIFMPIGGGAGVPLGGAITLSGGIISTSELGGEPVQIEENDILLIGGVISRSSLGAGIDALDYPDAIDPLDFFAEQEGIPDYVYLTPVLAIDGVEVPFTDYEYDKAPDRIGSRLSITLASSVQALPTNGVYTFTLVYKDADLSVVRTDVVLSGGRLNGRTYTMRYGDRRAADQLVFDASDNLTDRMNRAPDEAPLTFYDPATSVPDDITPNGQSLHDRITGAVIVPVQTPVVGLSLYRAFDEAYRVGCGFDSVLTNISNFKVPRVDFTLEGGYDAGIRPLIDMFRPQVYTVGNQLRIAWPGQTPPGGYTPRTVSIYNHSELQEEKPASERVSVLLLSYQVTVPAGADYRIVEVPQNVSVAAGGPNYTVTSVVAIMKQWFDPMFPAIVLAEEQVGLRTTVTDNQGLLSRETLTEYFDALGRKVGHTKLGERRLPQAVAGTYPALTLGQDEAPPSVNLGGVTDSNGPMAVQRADVEIMNITYGADPANPRRSIILQQTTTTWKLVLEDHDEEYRGEPKMQPLADAHVNGVLDSNANQTVSFRLFESIIERTVPSASAPGRFGVAISRINHLAGGASSFEWHDRVGNADVPEPRTLTRNLLLRVPGVHGYRAKAMSCREVPTELALKLGDDELIRLADSPRRLQLTLAKPDTTLDRGSVIVPEGRDGLRGRFLVLGTRLTGSAMGTREQKQFMRVTGEEMREGT